VSWSSFIGGIYQVEQRTTASASWTPVPSTIVAASKEATLTNAVSGTSEQYYRVRLLP